MKRVLLGTITAYTAIGSQPAKATEISKVSLAPAGSLGPNNITGLTQTKAESSGALSQTGGAQCLAATDFTATIDDQLILSAVILNHQRIAVIGLFAKANVITVFRTKADHIQLFDG